MTAVGSNSDARKRRQESVPADETVRVPAADILALADGWAHDCPDPVLLVFIDRLRALVDAAERPDEGEQDEQPLCTPSPDEVTEFIAFVERKWSGGTGHTPNNRWVSHAQLRKHAEAFAEEQAIYRQADEQCAFHTATPAPLSSPRRTRDDGSEDEAEAAWAGHVLPPERQRFVAAAERPTAGEGEAK